MVYLYFSLLNEKWNSDWNCQNSKNSKIHGCDICQWKCVSLGAPWKKYWNYSCNSLNTYRIKTSCKIQLIGFISIYAAVYLYFGKKMTDNVSKIVKYIFFWNFVKLRALSLNHFAKLNSMLVLFLFFEHLSAIHKHPQCAKIVIIDRVLNKII